MGRAGKIARRSFLIGSVAVAGGVAFGYWRYKTPYANPLLDDLPDDAAALTPYIRIDQGGVTIITPRAEMGQGVHTTLAALVAEELDVSLDNVNVEHGPASKAYYNAVLMEEGVPFPSTQHDWKAETLRSFTHVPAKFLGLQITGGSTSIHDAYYKMRLAGAAARQVLLEAAADQLGVDAGGLTTDDGHVVASDGTKIPYTSLAVAAAQIDPPGEPPLKPQSAWKLLGRSLPRIDLVAKSTGTAEFGVDVRLPDMVYATVRMSPKRGAMTSYDAARAESMPGVKKVVPLDGGVAVVATNTWYAFQAAKAIDVDWADAPYPATSEAMIAAIEQSFVEDYQDSQLRDDGDIDTAFIEADVIEAEYRAPFLAHATMEPMNATALLKDGRLDVWTGSQFPTQIVKEAQATTGLDDANIHVHTPYLGGGFGRR
ncbi:MAG: molybdopterin cofactor-binding domain-containing protein, partial [Woeseiaceae bacterium]|nr:molybdopterin cofactor-binding domain-containing protein [Woeseiaceae bacterium]